MIKMNSYIYFEDLVANALIGKIEHQQGKSVTLSELMDYESRIVDWWKRYKNIRVTVLDSRYDVDELFRTYSDYFSKYYDNDVGLIIYLNDGKTSDDLRKKFRSYLTVDMLLCFTQSYAMGRFEDDTA